MGRLARVPARLLGCLVAGAVLAGCGAVDTTTTVMVHTKTMTPAMVTVTETTIRTVTRTPIEGSAPAPVSVPATPAPSPQTEDDPDIPPNGVGTVKLSHLPDSTEDQAAFTLSYACPSSATSCIWFAEASQYPGAATCPGIFDTSRSIGIGTTETATPGRVRTVRQKLAFQPDPGSSVQACLYVHDASDNTDNLVQQG